MCLKDARMRTAPLLVIGLMAAAASVLPQAAAAQTATEGSVHIEAAGGVLVAESEPSRQITSPTFIIFALSTQANGSLTLSVSGFLKPDGAVLSADGGSRTFSGTTLDQEALSVSIGGGEAGSPAAVAGFTVVLAQYN
jgi:hypothetical protein